MPGDKPLNTDDFWEHLAQTNPYWAVLTADEFRTENLDQGAIDRFYATGEETVDRIIRTLFTRFPGSEHLQTTLDFGCGVGRLLFALAKRSDSAIGVDVSDKMLQICADNAQARHIPNITLVKGDDSLSQVAGPVDLITSQLVFQHIPPERGYRLLGQLLQLLEPGGYGYIHIPYASEIGNFATERSTPRAQFRYYQRLGNSILRLVKTPLESVKVMEMNHYNLNEVLCLLLSNEVTELYLRHKVSKGILNADLFFRKSG
jgi:trans-aconitate methyltransferase